MTDTAPQVDVVDLLTADHHDILDLLGQIEVDLDPAARRDLADTVIAELVRHSVAEEMWVYPAMREHLPDGDTVVAHDIEEHQELEQALQQWQQADDDAGFRAARDRVEHLLRHHAGDEEREQFPLLRRHIPAKQLRHMGRQVQAAKQIAPTRPHPNSPHSELFHKTLGPGVGLVDKMRDALSGRASNT